MEFYLVLPVWVKQKLEVNNSKLQQETVNIIHVLSLTNLALVVFTNENLTFRPFRGTVQET